MPGLVVSSFSSELPKPRQKQMSKVNPNNLSYFFANLLLQDSFFAVSSIALVKPEKAKMLENMLIQMAQRGQLGGKVSYQKQNYSLERKK